MLSAQSASLGDETQISQKLRDAGVGQASDFIWENSGADYVRTNEIPSPRGSHGRTMSVIPLIFLIFYEVSGGPFGVEDSVKAAGPLLALAGFLIFPWVCSVPEALITAEMVTMFPEDGGSVVWVFSALGPFWGYQLGIMKWIGGVVDNALYPVLFLDYLKSGIPALGSGLPRITSVLALTVVLTYMNYRGLAIVGWAAVVLAIISILPFVVMGLISVPKIRPERWLLVDIHTVDWGLYLNTLVWNLSYWDSISTLAGEVENPGKNMPRALFYAVILVILGYLFPLLIGTGAIPLHRDSWTDGYFSEVAKIIGGAWLSWWVQVAAALANMGLFVAGMSTHSFQLLGMAERGMLPEFFGRRSKYGTPIVGLLLSASGVVMLSCLSFQEIVAAENFMYCFGLMLEFVAFVRLRIVAPLAPRPYKIPVGTVGAIVICILPIILMCVVLAFSSVKILVVSVVAFGLGLVLQLCIKYSESRRLFKFSVSSHLPDIRSGTTPETEALIGERAIDE